MSKKTITFKIQKKKEDESVVNKNNKDPFHHTETTKPSVFSDIKKKKPDVSKSVAKKSDAKESEDKLERDAIEEILRETHRGATRAEVSGSWRPPKRINSRILQNTLIQTIQSNKRQRTNKMKNKNQRPHHDGTENSS